VGDYIIYICLKCKFLFERKNEPSKCPDCETQSIVGANAKQREKYQALYDSISDPAANNDGGLSIFNNPPHYTLKYR